MLCSLLIGTCVGSFLNVVIYRLPIILANNLSNEGICDNTTLDRSPVRKFNLCLPRSYCYHCHNPLPIKYNIPVIGWLLLRGVSHCCRRAISRRYIIVELLTAILTLMVYIVSNDFYIMLSSLILIWALIVLTFIDLDTFLLPDCITLPLLWIGLIININGIFAPLYLSVLGAVSGYLFLWFPYWIFKLIKGGDGMGYGDFKLMAALGAWFGISAIPLLVLLSSCFGIISYIIFRFFLKKNINHIAFGPYISLVGCLYLFFVIK